jgi:hypothetical protein
LRRLLVTANIASSPILVTLLMEALGSSETSVPTRATQRNIPEDGILHSHNCEDLKSYKLIHVAILSVIVSVGASGLPSHHRLRCHFHWLVWV